MDAEYEVKYAEAQSQLEYYEKQVQGDDSLRKRIEGFRKTLTQNQVLEEFDRAVFESIVEKVIVGGYDDDGNADPYKVTFIYKTGFKDSFFFHTEGISSFQNSINNLSLFFHILRKSLVGKR